LQTVVGLIMLGIVISIIYHFPVFFFVLSIIGLLTGGYLAIKKHKHTKIISGLSVLALIVSFVGLRNSGDPNQQAQKQISTPTASTLTSTSNSSSSDKSTDQKANSSTTDQKKDSETPRTDTSNQVKTEPETTQKQETKPEQQAPAPSASPETQKATVEIISVTSPAPRNSYATLKAKVPPGATATIEVDYKSGPSHAAGLGPKQAGPDGIVSWTWKVGGNTTIGTWPITVSCNGTSASTTFEVVH
jgi:cytoskeletal protein RodZ